MKWIKQHIDFIGITLTILLGIASITMDIVWWNNVSGSIGIVLIVSVLLCTFYYDVYRKHKTKKSTLEI